MSTLGNRIRAGRRPIGMLPAIYAPPHLSGLSEMITNEKEKRFSGCLIHLLILSVVVLGIGTYLILTTVFIADDGFTYLKWAQRLSADPATTIRQSPIHPGYLFTLLFAKRIVASSQDTNQLTDWILPAQCATLACRLATILVLYLMGRLLVGPRMSFWGAFIVCFLPYPAKYGSDILSDWPHLLFLVLGLYLLTLHMMSSRMLLVFLLGLVTGFAYLVRPEGVQLLLYGIAWLLFILFKSPNDYPRKRCLISIGLLVAGFTLTAAPYMQITGYVFPERELIPLNTPQAGHIQPEVRESPHTCCAAVLHPKIVAGGGQIANNVCEMLVYYFVPAWLIGVVTSIYRDVSVRWRFLIATFVIVNVAVLLWQFCNHSAISRRYTLPLVAVTGLYIPVGIRMLSKQFSNLFTRPLARTDTSKRTWFVLFVAVGVAICGPKLLTPLHAQRLPSKKAVLWLRENTEETDYLYVPYKRIALYACRDFTTNPKHPKPTYSVREQSSREPLQELEGYEALHAIPANGSQLVIYRRVINP